MFYSGIFRIGQSQGYTELKLIEKLAPCAKRATAGTAAEKPKTRKLWGPDFRRL